MAPASGWPPSTASSSRAAASSTSRASRARARPSTSSCRRWRRRVDTAHATPRPAAAVESASILLIEDDAALRRLLARSLERVGHRVRDAADSGEALALLAADPAIDLLITDAVLPGQSGPNLARQIEAGRPSLRVLFISGYTDDAILRLGLLNEQEAFLQKPFGPRSFVHKVQQVLRG